MYSMIVFKMRNSRKQLNNKSKAQFLKGMVFGTLGFCTSFAVDDDGLGPEWIEVIELDLPLNNLPPNFDGKRIVQISDLHCGRTVSGEYLKRCIQRVNQLDPDIVALTGDYVTYDGGGKFKNRIK